MVSLNIQKTRRALKLLEAAYPRSSAQPPCLNIVEYGEQAVLRARDGMDLEISIPMGEPLEHDIKDVPFHAIKALLRPQCDAEHFTIVASKENEVRVDIDGLTAQFLTRGEDPYGSLIKETVEEGFSQHLRIDAAALYRALRLVSKSISTEETRYYLNGVFLGPHPSDPSAIIFCATDGHRLVKHVLPGVSHSLKTESIIPRAAVLALLKLLCSCSDKTIFVNWAHPLRLTMECGEFELSTRLIDGTFPNYERVIPENPPLAFSMDTAALMRFLTRLKGIGDLRSGVAISGSPAQDYVTVRCNINGVDRIEARIPGRADVLFQIGFQARYLTNALTTICAPQIRLFAQDPAGPTVFSGPAELADQNTTIVIMPMRV